MAINIRHDHRVSSQREAVFNSFVAGSPTGNDLKHALREYKQMRVVSLRYPPASLNDPPPDFLDMALNGDNWVNPPSGIRVPGDVELVRLLDISGMHSVFLTVASDTSAGPRFEWLKADFAVSSAAGFYAALDSVLMPLSKDQRTERAVLFLEAANYHRRHFAPYQPVWATTWAAFEEFQAQEPERWSEVLGVPRLDARRWLLLLRYRVSDTGDSLVRPTQLDCGWLPQHFPSPPEAPLAIGGHPMDLRETPRASRLLPEYIHAQIDHLRGHVAAFQPTNRAVPGTLMPQRGQHLDLLRQEYTTWMRSPM